MVEVGPSSARGSRRSAGVTKFDIFASSPQGGHAAPPSWPNSTFSRLLRKGVTPLRRRDQVRHFRVLGDAGGAASPP